MAAEKDSKGKFQTVHLFLTANGTAINGESSQKGADKKDSIECFEWRHAGRAPRDAATGQGGGRIAYEFVKFKKYVDKATPMLFKAMVKNEKVNGKFNFFQPSPDDGTDRVYYTVECTGGLIASIEQSVDNSTAAPGNVQLPREEVEMSFDKVVWTIIEGNIKHEDSWSER